MRGAKWASPKASRIRRVSEKSSSSRISASSRRAASIRFSGRSSARPQRLVAQGRQAHRARALRPGGVARADHQQRVAAEAAGGEAEARGDREQGGAHFELAVRHPLFDQLPAGFLEGQADARVALPEVFHHRREELIHHRRHAHRQLAAGEFGEVGHLAAQPAHPVEGLLAALENHPAHVGEAQLAPVADQQRLADLVLELADHLAHRRLGDVERVGRLGEAVVADGLDEITEGAQVHGFA